MKKIIFITTYDYNGLRDSLPLGQLSLASIVKSNSEYDVEIVEMNRLYKEKKLDFADDIELDLNIVTEYVMQLKPDIISIYTMCNNYHIALLLAKTIKKSNDRIKIIFAGPQATLTAKETLMKFDYVDFIGLGEGENTIINILDGILTDDFSNVNGLAYRKDGDIKIRWDRSETVDLNRLPLLDINLLGLDIKKNMDIEVGRGCPFSCIYCSTRLFWGKRYRLKSIERIIYEIKQYHERYKTTFFSFQHDLFTANRKFILEFCQRLKKENLEISWGCSSRIDTIDSEMIVSMSAAGCKEIFFGIETGSDKIQKLINKNLDLSFISVLEEQLIKNGITPTFSFIYGFPDEDTRDLNMTLQMMYEIKKKFFSVKAKVKIQLWPLNYLAGTDITERYYNELELSKDVKYDFHYSTILKNSKVKSLIEQHKEIFTGYYTLNSNILNDTKYINSFYMKLLNFSYSYINLTVDFLISIYDQDLYKLFNDIMYFIYNMPNQKFVKDILISEGIVKEEIKYMIKIIKDFINSKDFGVNNTLLRDLIDFEENLFIIIFSKNKLIQQKIYNYDVFTMKKDNKIYMTKKEIILEFQKNDGEAYVNYIKGDDGK